MKQRTKETCFTLIIFSIFIIVPVSYKFLLKKDSQISFFLIVFVYVHGHKENLGQQVIFIYMLFLSQPYDKVAVREKVHSLSLAF